MNVTKRINLLINNIFITFTDIEPIINRLQNDDEYLQEYVLQSFAGRREEVVDAGLLNQEFSTLEIQRVANATASVEGLPEELQCSTESSEVSSLKDQKIWSHEATLLLISLVKKYDKELETKIKKRVWQKIATDMSTQGYTYSLTQVESKWKTLIRMYKATKKNNEESGKNRKNWRYWDVIHEIVFSKAEIVAPATCSSSSGLIINKDLDRTNDAVACSSGASTPPTSSFMQKRKMKENSVERRHREKMQKLDALQESVNQLLSWLHNENTSS